MSTRRRFLHWTGLGAAALAAGRVVGPAASATAADAVPAARTKARFELGLASYTLHRFPLNAMIPMTRRVGLKWVCAKSNHLPLESTPEQLAASLAAIQKAGLKLYAVGVIYMTTEAQVTQAFEYAKAAGVDMIVGVPTVALLPAVNEAVRKYNIRLAIHNHGPGDKIYPTPGVAYEKIKDLDRRVGLCIDIGHTVRAGDDLNRDIEQYADRLLDIHVKDVSAAAAHGATVEAGRGVIDLPAFFRTLLKINYAGIVAFEHEKDPTDPLPGLAESVGYVRGVTAVI